MEKKGEVESLYSYRSVVVDELPVLRARARLSQEEVASGIGISRQTYNSIETGKKEISITIFFALIAFLQNNSKTEEMILNIIDDKNEKLEERKRI